MAAKKPAAQARATFALVGDGDSVSTFIDTLTQTPTLANQLSGSLNQLKSDLDQIISVLTYTKTVSDDLNNLDTVLSTASELLTAVEIIPEIGEEVAVIQEAVQSLQTEVDSAKDVAASIDAEVAPVRDALSQLDPLLADAIQGANDIASTSQTFLTDFTGVDNCINSLPDGPPKTTGLDYLSSFAATTTPYVSDLNTALGTVNGVIGDFYSAITAVENQLSFMSQISDAIESVLNELSPILGPLKSLQSLLNTTITIPTPVPFYGVHVSIADILTDFKAFMDLAMSVLNPVLQPILQPLEDLANSIISQIPGIDQLLNLQLNLPTIPDFSDLFGNLTVLISKLEAALNLFSLACPPQAAQATFAAELDRHMKGVGDFFAQGAVHSISLGPDQHLAASGGKVAASSGPVGKKCLFRAHVDLSKRVVFTAFTKSNRKILAHENGALVLKEGPVTPAAHFRVVPKGGGKFALRGAGNRLVEVDGKSEFTAKRH